MSGSPYDLAALRDALEPLTIGLAAVHTHPELLSVCASYGLPTPPTEGTKRERMIEVWSQVNDSQLPALAERFLQEGLRAAQHRNRLQDLLWAAEGHPVIVKRVRRDIATALASSELWLDEVGMSDLLDSLWVLDDPSGMGFLTGNDLRAQIQRHVFSNRDDWDAPTLFAALGAYDASDRRFALWLEGLASDAVLPDPQAQASFASKVNGPLQPAGLALQELGTHQGYPEYRLVNLRVQAMGRPKNIIFASQVKPDLRFRDALDNDVEIASHADQVLIYDRPIQSSGLTWSDLQGWWTERTNCPDDQRARRTLWSRLLASLPESSPPQRNLFLAYHTVFSRSIKYLPALLPEVWLLWDPRTVRQRGKEALLALRMDFVMLPPDGRRVVLEVDGRIHYTTNERPDPDVYARTVRSDRRLRLDGYDTYRFGASELTDLASAEAVAAAFFPDLLRQCRVKPEHLQPMR